MRALLAGDRKIVRMFHGFAASLGVGLAIACGLSAVPASAQILDPPGWRPEPPRRPARLRPTLPDDSSAMTEEDRRAFDSGAFGPEQAPDTVIQPPAEDGIVEPSDALRPALDDVFGADAQTGTGEAADVLPGRDFLATSDALSGDGSDAGDEAPLRRRILQDGDPVPVIEEAAVQDGIIAVGDSWAPVEGQEDITEVDMRSPEDVRAFVGEPAGYDPLLLQADESNPVFSPSTFQGFIVDPFPQLGTRIGSFLLFTTVEANWDFNSNLFAAPNAEGDSSLEVRPAARLASNWSRHAVELRASGDLSFHDKYPSEDDRAYLVEGLGRLDVTSFTNLQGLIAHELAQEGRSAINAQSAGTRPNIEVTRLRGALNHRFNRLSVQLRGNIIDTSYGTDILGGVVQSNSDRDYTLYEEAVRPRWEFSPYLFAFTDISINQRDYSTAAFSDGILRSSTGERYRLGLSFGDVSQILRGNVSLGYGHQELDNRELPPVDGLLIDADLAWQVTPLTVLSFTATSEVAETTTTDSPGVLERNYGLEARHSFTRYLVGSAGLSYFTRNFGNVGINEEQLTGAVGTEYYANRWAVLFARYQHVDFQSSQPDSSYTAEIVQAGVRLRH